MEDMKVTTTGYDFRPAHAAMQRYVDGNFSCWISRPRCSSVEIWWM